MNGNAKPTLQVPRCGRICLPSRCENETPTHATLFEPGMRPRRIVQGVGLRDAKGQFPLFRQGDQLAEAAPVSFDLN